GGPGSLNLRKADLLPRSGGVPSSAASPVIAWPFDMLAEVTNLPSCRQRIVPVVELKGKTNVVRPIDLRRLTAVKPAAVTADQCQQAIFPARISRGQIVDLEHPGHDHFLLPNFPIAIHRLLYSEIIRLAEPSDFHLRHPQRLDFLNDL